MRDNDQSGGPAFPVNFHHKIGEEESFQEWSGMSLRDYFAAAALTGQLASFSNAATVETAHRLAGMADSSPFAFAAQSAYNYADAMLAARNKSREAEDAK